MIEVAISSLDAEVRAADVCKVFTAREKVFGVAVMLPCTVTCDHCDHCYSDLLDHVQHAMHKQGSAD